MFAALLVSLGRYSLLKVEDKGQVFPKERYRVPDLRVVLLDGSQWLIEVKNVYERDPFQQKRRLMSRRYREKLENYASATGGELKLAVFWARWGIWTLVSPGIIADADGNLTLDMENALRLNELGQLGEMMIGTKPPLRFVLEADPSKPSLIAPDGRVEFTISAAKIYCGDSEILDPVEQQLAWIFMHYGDWNGTGPRPLFEGKRLTAIEYRCEPEEQKNEGFEMIGNLSRMFSRYYAEQTVREKEIVQLHAPARPEWFAPLVTPGYHSEVLPLWQFTQVVDS